MAITLQGKDCCKSNTSSDDIYIRELLTKHDKASSRVSMRGICNAAGAVIIRDDIGSGV